MSSTILDIHHHGSNAPERAVTSFSLGSSIPEGVGLLSAGIHPWFTQDIKVTEAVKQLRMMIEENPSIVAIGECGLDRLRGASLPVQLSLFEAQIELSEQLRKPLIIHSVRGTDQILQLHKQYNPSQNWAIHGFRGKPQEALQLTGKGIFLSFGERFNPESLAATPKQLILAESDESALPIEQIIQNLNPYITQEQIMENSARFLELEPIPYRIGSKKT